MYYCADEENVNEEIRKSTNYHFIKGNICDYDLVYNIISSNNIEYLIHFAAQSHVQNSFNKISSIFIWYSCYSTSYSCDYFTDYRHHSYLLHLAFLAFVNILKSTGHN